MASHLHRFLVSYLQWHSTQAAGLLFADYSIHGLKKLILTVSVIYFTSTFKVFQTWNIDCLTYKFATSTKVKKPLWVCEAINFNNNVFVLNNYYLILGITVSEFFEVIVWIVLLTILHPHL